MNPTDIPRALDAFQKEDKAPNDRKSEHPGMSATVTHIAGTKSALQPGKSLSKSLAGIGAAMSGAGQEGGPSAAKGVAEVFSALLELAQNAGGAKPDQSPMSVLSQMGVDRSALNTFSLDLGGKIDLASLIAAKLSSADAANSGAGSTQIRDAQPKGKQKPEDPLAAVIDQILAGLQQLSQAGQAASSPGGALASFSAELPDPQKLLSAVGGLLTAIEKSAAQPAPALAGAKTDAGPRFAQIDPTLLDKLKSLSTDLKQFADLSGNSAKPDGTGQAALSTQGQDVSANAQLSTKVRQLAQRVEAILTGAQTRPEGADAAHKPAPQVLTAAQLANPATATSIAAASALPAQSQAAPLAGKPQSNASTDATNGAASRQKAGADKPATDKTAPDKQGADRPAENASAQPRGGQAASTSATAQGELNATALHAVGQHAGAAPTRAATAPFSQVQQQIALPALAYEFVRQVNAGNTRFAIRLDPPELGKIDVKLDIDKSGALHARLTVERPDTLDLLQRDARGLERALTQAGLDGSKANLEFSLRQNPFGGQQFAGQRQGQDGQGQPGGQPGWDAAATPDTEAPPAQQVSQAYRGIATPGGINLLA